MLLKGVSHGCEFLSAFAIECLCKHVIVLALEVLMNT